MKNILFIKNKIINFIKHPLFSGSLIMVGGSMGANVINYLYHLLMGRSLGPVNYGVLASLYSIIYLVDIVPISCSVAIVKFISSSKNHSEAYSIYSSLKRFILLFSVIISSILLFLSPIIAKFLNISNFWMVALVSIILFFTMLILVNQAVLQGLLKFTGSVIPNFISSVAKLAIGLFLIFLGFSVLGAMWGVAIASILSYAYSVWYINRVFPKRKTSEFKLKPFFKYSLPVLVQALAFTSIFTIDVILVKHFLAPFEAGIYAAISTLGKIIFFATSPIAATMFPIVSGRATRGEKYVKVSLASFAVTALIASIIVLFYWLFPNIAIGVLYGKAYLSASIELVWMGLFILFYTLSSLLVNFSLSLGKIKIVVFPAVIALIQIPALWFFHGGIRQVVQISLSLSIILFLMLSAYLGYNYLTVKNGKH